MVSYTITATSDNSTSTHPPMTSFSQLLAPTRVQLFPRENLIQGDNISGTFQIDGFEPLNFKIHLYDTPQDNPRGGTLIQITYGTQNVCMFRPSDAASAGKRWSFKMYIMKAFLTALAGAEGKITGIASSDPVPFPLPDELKCKPDVK